MDSNHNIFQWSDIAGHTDVIRTLRTMLALRRVPHALLFSGPDGVGKMTVARIVAAGLLCESDGLRPCGDCPSCRLNQRESHPDLLRLEPDGAAIKIDQIRRLQHDAALSSALGRGRVCLINDAELMTTQAANSLLKLLEEPPPGFLFVLVAQDSRPLLPTIVSRCCRLRFLPLPCSLLTQVLLAQGVSAATAAVAARLGGGRVGRAQTILQPDGLIVRDQAMELLALLSGGGGALGLRTAVDAERMTSREAAVLLQHLLGLLRDVLMLKICREAQLIFSQDLFDRLAALTPLWAEEQLLRAMERVRETVRAVNGNANVRLSLEALWIRLNDLAQRREEGEYGNVC